MSKPTPHLVRVAKSQQQVPASRAHTQFNNLIKKIDKQKKQLADWIATESLYRNKVAKDYVPQHTRVADLKAELAQLFDRAHDDARFKKRDREKLSHLILSLAGSVLEDVDREDIRALYDKYSEVDFDTEQREIDQAEANFMRVMMEDLGIELGDNVDFSDPESMKEALYKKMREDQASQSAFEAAQQAGRKPRKKSAKQLEKEARQEAEEKNISKSIQAIYRKLVTELHPDREADPEERARKTELMQAVNAAYEKRDLLQLLELQITLEQISPEHIGAITEDRIKHYNKVLREQSAELQQELSLIQNELRSRFQLPYYLPLTPRDVVNRLNGDILHLKQVAQSIEHDLKQLADLDVMKQWVKSYKIPRPQPMDDLDFSGFGF
jgi:hypothetical protein